MMRMLMEFENVLDQNQDDPQSEVTDVEQPEENPDRQGLIRSVEGARLVYKRQDNSGTYTELWIYNIDSRDYPNTNEIKQQIIAGTDIPVGEQSTPDGNQSFEVFSSGDIEMVLISGLVN